MDNRDSIVINSDVDVIRATSKWTQYYLPFLDISGKSLKCNRIFNPSLGAARG